MMIRACSRAFATALLLSGAAQATDLGNGWSPNALEIAQLPQYCQKQFLSKHDAAVLAELFRGCSRMNHLCPGLVLIDRSSKTSIPKQERRRILGQAKGEINYSMSQLTTACVVYNDVKLAEQRIKLMETLLK